jgi:hypothetical protein
MLTEPQTNSLATKVKEAFIELRKQCPHKDMTDCAHESIEFNCMLCCPSNCPLL